MNLRQGAGGRPRTAAGPCCVFPGSEYSEEQTAWLRAMQALKQRLRRPPTWAEVLAEAKRLGYRRECGRAH